jgi:ribosomal protein S27AE
MGKKQTNILCVSCESPLRADSPFCPSCGRPTAWATHDERVDWEVRQWRASRAREDGSTTTTTMMLVRTEAGYEPSAVKAADYVWDQPLHPEREAKPNVHRATPRETPPVRHGNGDRAKASEPEAVEAVIVPQQRAPVAPAPIEGPSLPMSDTPVVEREPGTGGGISRKAVAVGLLLAVGLPLSGKALDLARSSPSAEAPARTQAATAGSIRPLGLRTASSGFTQVTPDVARYAAVIRNPNKGFAAHGVSVSVSMYDRRGRLVGSSLERIGSVPAGGSTAVAGHIGVAGVVAEIRAHMSVAGFEPSRSTRPFVVRGVRMSRRGVGIVVRASVSGVNPARNAKLVVVYLDRAGKIVGGDFTYVDVPSSPRAAAVIVTTSGVSRSAHHVQVYVVASQ